MQARLGCSILSAKKREKKNGIFLQKRQGSAHRRVLTAYNAVVLGTTTPTTRLFATGTHGVKKLRRLEAILPWVNKFPYPNNRNNNHGFRVVRSAN